MPRPEILAPFDMPALAFDKLERAFPVVQSREAAATTRLRGLAVSAHGPVGAAEMDALPALEIIANLGVGYENIDVAAAVARGIRVTHTPGVLSDDVADLAVALLLCTVRRLPQAAAFVTAGHWREGRFPLTSSLQGRRVGLVGYGRIGALIATRLSTFPVELAYTARSRKPDVPWRYANSALELARGCDTLIVVVPGGPATDGLIDAAVLEALGPNGVLINVARGSVVDEDALVHALQTGKIEAAGLDVFASEPDVRSDLLALDSVVALPHVGSATRHTRGAMADLMVANLTAWFDDRRMLSPVPECRALD